MLNQPIIFLAASLSICTVIWLASWLYSRRLTAQPTPVQGRLLSAAQAFEPYSRRVVFALATTWATFLYVYSANQFAVTSAAVSYLSRMYGLSALVGLGCVLIVGLLRAYFPRSFADSALLHVSRGVGLSTFLLASLHLLCSFFGNLDGTLGALAFLSTRHQWALIFSATAFGILFLMAITSVDRIISWMTFKRWKLLHRFVYAVCILVVLHAFMIGSHFTDWTAMVPRAVRLVALTFVLLEIGATYKKLTSKNSPLSHRSKTVRIIVLCIVATGGIIASQYRFSEVGTMPNSHSNHSTGYANIYSIQVATSPEIPIANQPVKLTITVLDSNLQASASRFDIVHDRLMHLMVVSNDMSEYAHLHPEHRGNGVFTAEFTPKSESRYYLYAQFKPVDQAESLASAAIATSGAATDFIVPELATDVAPRQSGDYSISLDLPATVSTGTDYLARFTLTNTATGQKVKTVEPYLGAFGHVAVLSADKMSFLHVHPTREAKSTQEKAGPDITFMTKFDTPGIYRLYAEFLVNGQIRMAYFTVEAE